MLQIWGLEVNTKGQIFYVNSQSLLYVLAFLHRDELLDLLVYLVTLFPQYTVKIALVYTQLSLVIYNLIVHRSQVLQLVFHQYFFILSVYVPAFVFPEHKDVSGSHKRPFTVCSLLSLLALLQYLELSRPFSISFYLCFEISMFFYPFCILCHLLRPFFHFLEQFEMTRY